MSKEKRYCAYCGSKLEALVFTNDNSVKVCKSSICNYGSFEHCLTCHKPLHDGDGENECRDCIDNPKTVEIPIDFVEKQCWDAIIAIHEKVKQKRLISEIMKADEEDGIYCEPDCKHCEAEQAIENECECRSEWMQDVRINVVRCKECKTEY